jgi:hypothetical protein
MVETTEGIGVKRDDGTSGSKVGTGVGVGNGFAVRSILGEALVVGGVVGCVDIDDKLVVTLELSLLNEILDLFL